MKCGWLLLGVLAACEPHASASDPQPNAPPPPGLASREYETCHATADCTEGLHCVESACRRMVRSRVGDYQAAVGAQAAAKGDPDAAVAAYAAALAQYGQEHVEAPPEIDCAYGATLAAAAQSGTGDAGKKDAELAARVLHRCVLAVPPGSGLRDRAFASLATLGPLGLDPALLGGDKVGDVYLTKAPKTPSTDKLVVSVVASPPVTSKSFPQITDALAGPVMRSALITCWQPTKALAVTLPLKAAFVESDLYEGEGKYVARVEGTPVDAAEGCVRSALDPVLKAMKFSDGFATKLAITIQ